MRRFVVLLAGTLILAPLREYNRRYPQLGSEKLERTLLENLHDYYHPENRSLIDWFAAEPPDPLILGSCWVVRDLFTAGRVVTFGNSGLFTGEFVYSPARVRFR